MGLPALKHEVSRHRVSVPALKLVTHPARTGKKRACDRDAAARSVFRSFAAVVIVVALLGVGRVWMSVQAAEASLRSSELRKAIKNARYEGDMLEIRLSALASPSRVKAIATTSLGMAEAGKVTYLDASGFVADIAATASSVPTRDRPASANGTRNALSDMLDLAATEAQILLVGDVGLVSAR